MASSASVTTRLIELLQKPGGRVVLLSGPWGCGKTYLWRNSVLPKIPGAHFFSLFGLESVGALKAAVASANIQQTKLKEFSVAEMEALAVAGGKALAEFVFRSTLLNKHLDPISLVIPDQVVCFDDLERISPNVALKDVLGVANFLAEMKSWRVLIIVNHAELVSHSSLSLEVFDKYRERVVDREFKLTAELDVMFDVMVERSEPSIRPRLASLKALVLEVLGTGEVQNLRTLRRAFDECLEFIRIAPKEANVAPWVRFLISLRCEWDAGRHQPFSFFSFDPHLLADARERVGGAAEPMTTARDKFIARYYQNQKDDYLASAAVHELLAEGRIDSQKLLTEIAPASVQRTPSEKLLAEVLSGGYRYLTDGACRDFQNKLKATVALDSELSVHALVTAWVYHCAMRRMLSLDPDLEFARELRTRILSRVDAGDRTYDEVSRMQYFESRPELEHLLVGFDDALARANARSDGEELAKVVDRLDDFALMRLVVRNQAKLRACLSAPVVDALFASFGRDRRFHVSALSLLADELENHAPFTFPDLGELRRQFAERLNTFLASDNAGLTDRWRLAGVKRKAAFWAPSGS